MHHFLTIPALIDHIDGMAVRYDLTAEKMSAWAVDRKARPTGYSQADCLASAANSRGNAAAYRAVATILRDTVIGADRHTAKPLEECR
jgi:hypothetical protein